MANAEVTFKFPNTKLFRARGKVANAIMAREAFKGVVDAGLSVERRAREEAPKVFNELARSIIAQPTVVPLMSVIAPNVLYGTVVHEGRKPGRRPPIQPLQLWARRKFGVGEGEAARIAFLVSRKIGRSGTQPNKYMERALAAATPEMNEIWDEVLERITAELN